MAKHFFILMMTLVVAGMVGGAFLSGVFSAQADSTKLEDCPTGNREKCTNLENPLKSKTTNVVVIIGTIIRYALMVIGSFTLLMVVWGGFQWLTSVGNAEKIKKGSQTMIWAAIGVVLVLASYLILSTYVNYLTGKT
jgi:hypothetical protein